MLVTPIFGRYRVTEFIQFLSNAVLIGKKHDPAKLNVGNKYNVFVSKFDTLEEAYKKDKTSELTPVLQELDNRRDLGITCLKSISEGFTYHFDKVKREAGRAITDCIAKYGVKIYDMNYEAETATLSNIVSDLEKNSKFAEAVGVLKLKDVVAEIKGSNNEFEKVFVQRLGEISKQTTRSSKELMTDALDAYKILTSHIVAHATLTPSEAYTAVINHLNENTEHFNGLVERRADRSTDEETMEEQTLENDGQ